MDPSLVVSHSQVVDRGHELECVPVGIEVPLAPGAHRTIECVDPSLPRGVEHRFMLFVHNRTHILLAAQIVYAVHWLSPGSGNTTLATPTIASRVTRAASCSSVIDSVPAGR